MSERRKISPEQAGMASILITMIMMVVISLVILGFAEVSRREQKLSLNSQLSTQAYYAAETGISDALAQVNADIAAGNTLAPKTQCGPDSSLPALTNNVIDPSNNIQYTCLLMNPVPTTLVYSDVQQDHSTVVQLNAFDGSGTSVPPNPLTIQWQANDAADNYSNCPSTNHISQLPAEAGGWGLDNCSAGLLQLDLVPDTVFTTAPTGSSTYRSDLQAATKTVYLFPVSAGYRDSSTCTSTIYGTGGPYPTISYSSLDQCPSSPNNTNGEIIPVVCLASQDPACQVSITGVSGAPGDNIYYMKLLSFYTGNTVDITSCPSPGTCSSFHDAQVEIDSTGQAQNVYRRIKVNAPLSFNASNTPEFAIQSAQSICKLFTFTDLTTTNASNPQFNEQNIPNTENDSYATCNFPV